MVADPGPSPWVNSEGLAPELKVQIVGQDGNEPNLPWSVSASFLSPLHTLFQGSLGRTTCVLICVPGPHPAQPVYEHLLMAVPASRCTCGCGVCTTHLPGPACTVTSRQHRLLGAQGRQAQARPLEWERKESKTPLPLMPCAILGSFRQRCTVPISHHG